VARKPVVSAEPKPEGLRERKRRRTRQRILEAGVGLFLAQGYEETTLDVIANAAEISKRTFFHYFKSKDDILFAVQEEAWVGIRAELRTEPTTQAPLDAVRNSFIKHLSGYESDDMRAMDRLMRSSPTLQARKQSNYEEQERALFAVLCELWPQPKRRAALRLVAMVSVGAFRLALEEWGQQTKWPIRKFLQDAFDGLRAEV
jgi:AcrR family transcriptional regulator